MGDKSKLPSDYLVEPDNAASLNSFVSSTQDSRMISYVSRINYDYDDRYYIAGSFRRDGSSRLSPEKFLVCIRYVECRCGKIYAIYKECAE